MENGNPLNQRQHHRAKLNGSVTLHPVLPSKLSNTLEVHPVSSAFKGIDVSEGGLCLELGDTNNPS